MTIQDLALALILATSLVTGAGRASPVIELRELQAVSPSGPPYIFRLPLTLQRSDQSSVPAVIVRRPAHVLSLVNPEMIELHLPTLTEVEVEIRYAGQTLNRLFPIAELQMARAPLLARLAAQRHRFLPASSQEDRMTARAGAETLPASLATSIGVERRQLEDEIRLIREDIQRLVAPVVPWAQGSAPLPQEALNPLLGRRVALWGVAATGLVALAIVLIRHQALECQRQQLFAVRLAKARMALPRPGPPWGLPTAPPSGPAVRDAGACRPLVVTPRRRRLWYRVTRRVRLCPTLAPAGTPQHDAVASVHRGGELATPLRAALDPERPLRLPASPEEIGTGALPFRL